LPYLKMFSLVSLTRVVCLKGFHDRIETLNSTRLQTDHGLIASVRNRGDRRESRRQARPCEEAHRARERGRGGRGQVPDLQGGYARVKAFTSLLGSLERADDVAAQALPEVRLVRTARVSRAREALRGSGDRLRLDAVRQVSSRAARSVDAVLQDRIS